MPSPRRMNERLGRAVHRGEAARCRRPARPVISATWAGVKRGSTSRSTRSKPSVCGGEVVAVGEPVAHQDVHDAERQRGVGADADRQVPVGAARGAGAARIDDDERHAALARRLDQRPEMHVGRGEVGAPGDDQVGVDRPSSGSAPPTGPTVTSQASSQQVSHTVPACSRRGAERMEQAVAPGRGSSAPDARCRRSRAGRAARSRR